MDTISNMTRRHRLNGHVIRMDRTKQAKISPTWTPGGKRKRGRPKETWGRTIQREQSEIGFKTQNSRHVEIIS